MTAVHPIPVPRERARRFVETVRWAPAPTWGESGREHRRFALYVAGSMLAWAVAGLVMAALVGAALSLVV